MEFKHISVLKDESISGLNVRPECVYVDCTTGGGGHSLEIAKQLTSGHLYCFDKDEEAIASAKKRLKNYLDKITFIHSNFADIKKELKKLGVESVDGVIADLGVSSYQLDNGERGFSYMNNGVLDMRMDKTQSLSAIEVVNGYSQKELERILFEYGEEKHTKSIVKKIIEKRQKNKITTTFELRDIIKSCYPANLKDKPGISGRTFQAIRIEVNNELEDLKTAVEDMISLLNSGGRICIITFHQLEDRIVKSAFKLHSTDCLCPPKIPKCVCGHKSDLNLINKKPIVAGKEELQNNSRSESAKLRIAEKK